MKALLVSLFFLPFVVWGQAPVSSTQQDRVLVVGSDSRLRGAIVQDAERLIKQLDELASPAQGKPHSVRLTLLPSVEGKPSAIAREFLKTDDPNNRYLLEVKMRLGQGNSFDQVALNRVLVEMLLIERTLRALGPDEIADRVEIRPWLIDGLSEALEWKNGKGDRRVYSSLVKSGGWMEVELLVEQDSVTKMNLLSRELFRASSGALVMALLAQPGGKEAMENYLAKVATFEGEHLTLLRSHFPQVNLGREGLERWWMLQVAAMSEAPLSEVMTIPETEKELKQGLKLYFKDPAGQSLQKDLSFWREIQDLETEEQRRAAIGPAADFLTNLSYRCFSTYRSVLIGYLQVLEAIASQEIQDDKEIQKVFENLRIYREAETKRHQMMVDLLDYYHLSTVQEESGAFEDFLKFKENVKTQQEEKADPLNRYLDRVQGLYEPLRR